MHLKSRHRQKYSQQMQRGVNHKSQVPTVSIFLKDLDNHIAESYQKLRRSKQKVGSSSKRMHSIEKSAFDQTLFREGSTMFREGSTMFDNSSKNIGLSTKREESGTVGKDDERDIPLLDNQEVNEYIRYVYEIYNIPDPLSSIRQPPNISQSEKSIPLLKTPSIKKRSSASELKDKIVLQRDIDLTPFNAYSSKKEDRGFDFSLRTQQSKQQSKDLKSTALKSRNTDAIPQTIKLSHRHRKTPSVQIDRPVPQVFRYCLACEEAVLQANLRHHESTCRLLQDLFEKSLEDLVEHLDQKIRKIANSVQTEFVEASNEKWLSEFRNLKRSVGEWVSEVQGLTNKENKVGNSARRKMSDIQESWGRALSSRFDQLAKLHWFARLRENLRRAYSI